MYETCPHCSQSDCCYSCDLSVAGFTGFTANDHGELRLQTEQEVCARLAHNGAVDGIMALILAQSQAGIDVTIPAYLESIETALDAVGNN